MEYFEFTNTKSIKKDNTGPHATVGISVTRHYYECEWNADEEDVMFNVENEELNKSYYLVCKRVLDININEQYVDIETMVYYN